MILIGFLWGAVIIYFRNADVKIPPYFIEDENDLDREYHTEKTNDDKDTPNTLIENNAFIEMLYKKTLEQAEEIGQLRERIAQMQQRFEKDAANANTDTTASVG